MKFRDRISGKIVQEIPEPLLFGQWLLVPDSTSTTAYLNSCSAQDDHALVPDALGEWTLLESGNSEPMRGAFYGEAIGNPEDIRALERLGESLRRHEERDAAWEVWTQITPLAPGLNEEVEPHPLEAKIDHELPHIEEVSRKPRTHIRLESERVLVSRARRIDSRAPSWLASHTEDWEYRRITDVQPKRILAQVREEDWDIYENRVTARLIDNLVDWLRRRIAQVRRIRDEIFARLEGYRVAGSVNRHRVERIYRLWGEAWDSTQGKQMADERLRQLEALLYRLLKLMDSPLYRNVPRTAQVPRAIRLTNLLGNDGNYRGVARLWDAWSKERVSIAAQPAELFQQRQSLRRNFDAWCMLLAIRACAQLGLNPVDEDLNIPIGRGCEIRLNHGYGLSWNQGTTIQIVDDKSPRIRFVPLIHAIDQTENDAALKARLDHIIQSASDNSAWTVILHLAAPADSAHAQIAGIGNPPTPDLNGAVDFIAVSPFSLDSVERVARAIRWATLVPRMFAYPPQVPAPPREVQGTDTDWLRKRAGAAWSILKPPQDRQLKQFGLSRKLLDASDKLRSLSAESEEVTTELKKTRGDRRRTVELNRQKANLQRPLEDARRLEQELRSFEQAIDEAGRKLDFLATCPVCHQAGADFQPHDPDCFQARCKSNGCGALWGLRLDADTRSRIPVLQPGGLGSEGWPMELSVSWVDTELGCDVLALPTKKTGGRLGYRPPRTSRTS